MRSLRHQLVANQLWETVGFVAKAAFLILLTPAMLRVWGHEGYGEFAIASSAIIYVWMIDFGLRGQLRIDLCLAVSRAEIEKARRLVAEALVSLAKNIAILLIVVAVLTLAHFWSATLGIQRANEHLIFVVALTSSLVLLTGTALEPLVAKGAIGWLKLALSAGSLAALPAVALVLRERGSPTAAVLVWQGLLILSNLAVFLIFRTWREVGALDRSMFALRAWGSRLLNSFWYHLTTISGLTRTHGLTLVVSVLAGPAKAGVFFILLRLSEIISSLGSVSVDLLVSHLALTNGAESRRDSFHQVQRTSIILGGSAAIVITLAGPAFLTFWLKAPAEFGVWTGLAAALYGISTSFRQTAVNACAGLGMIRLAALSALAEVIIAVVGTLLLQPHLGLFGVLLAASSASIAFLPAAGAVAKSCETTPSQLWLRLWGQ